MTDEQTTPEALAEEPHAARSRRSRKKPEAETPGTIVQTSEPDVFDQQAAERGREAAAAAEREAKWQELSREGSRSARRHDNLKAIAIDTVAGVRLEEEEKPMRGQKHAWMLITFDEPPTAPEKEILRGERLRFDGEIGSWTADANPTNRVLAQRAYNDILVERGREPHIMMPSR